MKKLLKQSFVWLFLLSCLYLFVRLINLTALPIFTDEAIYIRWAQIGGQDASWRFISLTDGKQPLFTWLVMASIRIFTDPLVAGRIVSVVSGLFAMIGMYVLAREIFKSTWVGITASFLYVISPFALFYDRLAIYDSLVSALFIWNLYLAILLVRYIRLDIALIFGLSLGIGLLNKTSAFFSLYLLPFTLILFDWKAKKRWSLLVTWLGLVVVSAVLSQIIYSVLRLSPYFYIIAQKDTIFVYPFSLWITHPFEFFIGNITGMFDWLVGYLTWPIFLSAIAGLFFVWKTIREKIFLVICWLFPFIGLAFFGRVLYPRFILFMVMPLLILSAWSLAYLYERIKNQYVAIACIFFICCQSIFVSYTVVSDIKTAQIPKSEKGQYIDDWPSGWGVSEIVGFVKKEAQNGNVSLYTEGTFGLLPYAFEIYLSDVKNVDIHGIWPVPTELPLEIMESAQSHATFFVMYQNQTPPFQWHLELLQEFPKGLNEHSTMRLYKVNPL